MSPEPVGALVVEVLLVGRVLHSESSTMATLSAASLSRSVSPRPVWLAANVRRLISRDPRSPQPAPAQRSSRMTWGGALVEGAEPSPVDRDLPLFIYECAHALIPRLDSRRVASRRAASSIA